MNHVKPIKGRQQPIPTATPTPTAPPPISNNLQEECIRVHKVYDWVVAANQYRNKVPLPDDCRPLVDAAIRAGQNITTQCVEPIVPPPFPLVPRPQPTQDLDFSCTVLNIRRENIIVNGNIVRVGIVRFLFSATLLVRVFADGTLLCEFPATIQFDEEIVLCLPEPLDESNIICRITAVECIPSGNVLLGGMVELNVLICKEIQVEAEVKLEVLAKFCQPRPNDIPVPSPTPSFVCPPITFPPQCPDIFPRRNCDCQGTANALLTNSTVFFDGVAETGTEQLLADICPTCNQGGSTFSYTFIDTVPTTPTPTPTDEVLGDFSFVFTPVSIGTPVCSAVGGGLQLVVTATGIRTFTATGTTETLSAELTLQELPGAFDTFRLVLRNAVGVIVYDTGFKQVSDANVNVQDCITFPDVIPTPSIP